VGWVAINNHLAIVYPFHVGTSVASISMMFHLLALTSMLRRWFEDSLLMLNLYTNWMLVICE
jgi:hypothetical protein